MIYPSIAVIIPCRNAVKWIARAIESVLDQGYSGAEVVVVDDGSTDGSLEVIESFGSKIAWIESPSQGACAARNLGLSIANADYILFLDADDWLDPGYLEAVSKRLQQSDCDLVLTSFVLIGADLHRRYVAPPPEQLSEDAVLTVWLDDRQPYTAAMVFSSAFTRKIGGWDESVRVLQDFEFSLRAVLAMPRIGCAPGAVACYFQHDSEDRISASKDGAVWQTVTKFLDRHAPKITAMNRADHSRRLGRLYYRVARKLYQAGYMRDGDIALKAARRLGFRGHVASGFELIAMATIGLKHREMLGIMKRSMTRANAPTTEASSRSAPLRNSQAKQ